MLRRKIIFGRKFDFSLRKAFAHYKCAVTLGKTAALVRLLRDAAKLFFNFTCKRHNGTPLFVYISVADAHAEAAVSQMLAHLLCKAHRTVSAARAAEAYDELTLALFNI